MASSVYRSENECQQQLCNLGQRLRVNRVNRLCFTTLIYFCLSIAMQSPADAAIYYVDSQAGNDRHSGRSPEQAWNTLARASEIEYGPGDELRLKRGATYRGSLSLRARGSKRLPVRIGTYGDQQQPPIIDAKGHRAGVHLKGCKFVAVEGLEITADAGREETPPASESYGVLATTWATSINGMEHILLKDLNIHDIYPSKPTEHEGHNPTTYLGFGIGVHSEKEISSNILIENCRISRAGFQAISLKKLTNVRVLNNHLESIGGPGIQPGRCTNLLVRGNTVDGTGCSIDDRMHGRGSGIWPWTCENVLIEKNKFMHARGKADSCGVHIDYNCRDVVVQYNLSHDNEGGFVEILGNCHNCTYRYNISVNDGSRRKGVKGASQEGKILWTSGFVGKNPRMGPFNCYIYNNTIYADKDSRSCFLFAPSSEGLLVANNIFCLQGTTVALDRKEKEAKRQLPPIPRAVMRNNLYLHSSTFPEWLPIRNDSQSVGDPAFSNPGGIALSDYVPGNSRLVENRGIKIQKLPGDKIGLRRGLQVESDILGNPIKGRPDMGAIEIVESHESARASAQNEEHNVGAARLR